MRYLAFVVLLLLGCSYKSVELFLTPPPIKQKGVQITIEEEPEPLIGYIVNGDEQVPIKINQSIGSLIKAKLAQTKLKQLAKYTITLQIQKVRIVYFPKRRDANLFGKLLLKVRLKRKDALLIKQISLNRAIHSTPLFYKKKIKKLLESMVQEAVKIIGEMV